MDANSISQSFRLHLFDNDSGRWDTERLFGIREPDRLYDSFRFRLPEVPMQTQSLTRHSPSIQGAGRHQDNREATGCEGCRRRAGARSSGVEPWPARAVGGTSAER